MRIDPVAVRYFGPTIAARRSVLEALGAASNTRRIRNPCAPSAVAIHRFSAGNGPAQLENVLSTVSS